MAINDPEAIKFSDEQIRPIAEKIRGLKYELESMQGDWNGGINAMFPVDAGEIVEDGRESDSDLSGNDIVNVMVQVGSLLSVLDAVGVMDIIQKPCVRPFRAE